MQVNEAAQTLAMHASQSQQTPNANCLHIHDKMHALREGRVGQCTAPLPGFCLFFTTRSVCLDPDLCNHPNLLQLTHNAMATTAIQGPPSLHTRHANISGPARPALDQVPTNIITPPKPPAPTANASQCQPMPLPMPFCSAGSPCVLLCTWGSSSCPGPLQGPPHLLHSCRSHPLALDMAHECT
jgi:hypothetical protein